MTKVHFRSYIHKKMILFPQRIDKDIAEDAHREALDDAAHTAAVLGRVEEIYQEIIARVPEHQVQPTLCLQ